MKHNQFKTIDQVWNAVDQGKTIYWGNESYKVVVEPAKPNNPDFSKRDQKNDASELLSVRCISNWFGSVLHESELASLFTK